jgi:hypothetical protein
MIADLQSEIDAANPETAEHATGELARLLASLGLQNADQPELIREIEALDPRRRLVLRTHPAVIASIRGSLLLRLMRFAFEPHPATALDLAQCLDLVLERDLDLDLGGASVLARALVLARTLDLDLILDLARVLVLALDRTLFLGLDLSVDADLTVALARAGDLALLLDEAASRALGIQDLGGVGTALLDGALDDFTRTDLSAADMVGADLVGVRWSPRGTRWPSTTDVEQLRDNSRETTPESGIYVVVRGTPSGDRTSV